MPHTLTLTALAVRKAVVDVVMELDVVPSRDLHALSHLSLRLLVYVMRSKRIG